MPSNFLDLHIVYYCQLQCHHCYLNKGNTAMPLDMVKNVCMDFLNTGFPLPHSTIILSGGDPLLHPHFNEVCGIVRNLMGSVTLSTNGILIPRYVQTFHNNDSIQVSIDGDITAHDYIRGTGSYEKAVQGLKILQENGINHSISFTVNKQNVQCIDHIIDLCIETGSYLLNFNLYQPIQGNCLDPITFTQWVTLKRDVRKKLESHRIMVSDTCVEKGCIAGILGISVLPEGTYWDCSRNQKVLGTYPQKIHNVLFWDKIHQHGTRDQFQTCCRRLVYG
jgi:MoaA/NifB/PqqE/SkfB family radical SAM enzyme